MPSGTLSRRMTQLRGQGLSSGTVRDIAPREGEAAAPPAPPLPAATRVAGGGISEGRQLAAQLAREPRAAPKEMVDMAKYFSGADLDTKDTREGWQAYRERTAAVEKDLLKTADENPGSLETKAEQYERQLLEGAQNERGNYIVALPGMLLNRTEVKVEGPWTAEGARNPRQGLLRWAVPHDELDAGRENEPGGGMRKQTPTTEHMSTAFGGSTGEGIFVFAQGRLFVGDAEKIMQDMNVAKTSGASVNSLKFSAYHSSFLGGQPVEAAGEIGVDAEGRLVSISNLSGHYRPTPEHLINVLKFFAGRGVDISSQLRLGVSPKRSPADVGPYTGERGNRNAAWIWIPLARPCRNDGTCPRRRRQHDHTGCSGGCRGANMHERNAGQQPTNALLR